MAFIPVPNCVQYELRMLFDNQEVENTLWGEFPGTPTAAGINDMCEALSGWWVTNIKPNVVSTLQLLEVYGSDQSASTGPESTFVPTGTQAGTLASPALPNNVALCISFRTQLRGRSYRGRNYLPGIAEDGVTNNVFLAARTAMFVSAYTSLIGLFNDNAQTWVVASRFTSNAPRITGVAEPITAVVATDPIVDSQRRRLPGRGR